MSMFISPEKVHNSAYWTQRIIEQAIQYANLLSTAAKEKV